MSDLRIVSGEFKGRRLAAGDGRPTTGRVREAVFSALDARLGSISARRVLDLYCGSGAIALEAVSRGAEGATVVDLDTEAVETNVRELGVGERVEVVSRSVADWLESDPPGDFDLIFCDPPYTLAATEMETIEPKLSRLLAPGGVLAFESAAADEFTPALPVVFDRTWGRTRIRMHQEGE